MRKNKGITLIALIITIIVLLILAGVTINAIVGNESAMEKAKQAREGNEKGNDIDTIKLSYISSMAENESLRGDVAGLRKNLQESYGNGNVTVSKATKTNGENGIKVYLKDSDKYYFVDNNGNVTDATKEDFGYKSSKDVYAALYKLENSSNEDDLELVFYSLENDEKPASLASKTLVAPTDENLGWNISDEFVTDDADSIPWYNNLSKIKEATFVNEVIPIYTRNWFVYCSSLTKINNIQNLNTSNVTTMRSMFYGCISLTELDVSNFNTSNVTNMMALFTDCESLTELDVSNFDTSNVTDMGALFAACIKLKTIDVNNFDTSNVTTMYQMFAGFASPGDMQLEEINGLNNFDTNNVINMASMFQRCSSIKKLDLSSFSTSNVTNMQAMFLNCYALEEIKGLNNFDTSGLEQLNGMFSKCYNLSGEITLKCNITTNTKNRNAFSNLATQNNAKFTAKYTSNVSEEMLNNIRSTMTNGENVEFIPVE